MNAHALGKCTPLAYWTKTVPSIPRASRWLNRLHQKAYSRPQQLGRAGEAGVNARAKACLLHLEESQKH